MRYKVNPDVVAMRLAVPVLHLVTRQVPISNDETQNITYIG
jgi:hypothetical protein